MILAILNALGALLDCAQPVVQRRKGGLTLRERPPSPAILLRLGLFFR